MNNKKKLIKFLETKQLDMTKQFIVDDHEINLDDIPLKNEAIWDDEIVENDAINSPAHYRGLIEPIEVIEEFNLGFNLGNAIKYILRCEKKGNKKQDLQKAMWYINREINNG